MKRKNFLLFLLSLATLVSCGETSSSLPTESSSSNTTVNPTSSESSSTKTTTTNSSSTKSDEPADIGDILSYFGDHNLKVTIKDEDDDYIYDFYDDKGFQLTYPNNNSTSTIGAAQTKNGLFTFNRSGDTITTDMCFTKGSKYKMESFIEDYLGSDFYGAFDLLEDEYAIAWEEDDENIYTSDDDDVIQAVAMMYGIPEDYLDYVSVSDPLILEVTGAQSCEITGEFFLASTYNFDVNITFSSMEGVSNSKFETYRSTFTVPTYTDYPSDFKTGVKSFLGVDLPYLSSFTGYIQYGSSTNSDGSVSSYQYLDLSCGNKVTEFGAELEELGFDDNDSTTSNNYYTTATYSKLKSDGGETAASVYYSISLVYYSATYFKAYDSNYSTNYSSIYTDGYFSILISLEENFSATTLDAANKYIAANIKNSAGSTIVPTISFGETTYSSLSFSDLTSDYNDYYSASLNYYYQMTVTCVSEEDAVAALSAYFDIIFADSSTFIPCSYSSSSLTKITLEVAKTNLAAHSAVYAYDQTNSIEIVMSLRNTASSSSSTASYNAFYIVIMG